MHAPLTPHRSTGMAKKGGARKAPAPKHMEPKGGKHKESKEHKKSGRGR